MKYLGLHIHEDKDSIVLSAGDYSLSCKEISLPMNDPQKDASNRPRQPLDVGPLDFDVRFAEDDDVTVDCTSRIGRRTSKRVSFAETFRVLEFTDAVDSKVSTTNAATVKAEDILRQPAVVEICKDVAECNELTATLNTQDQEYPMPNEAEKSDVLEEAHYSKHNMTINETFGMDMTCVEPSNDGNGIEILQQCDENDQTIKLKSTADFFKQCQLSDDLDMSDSLWELSSESQESDDVSQLDTTRSTVNSSLKGFQISAPWKPHQKTRTASTYSPASCKENVDPASTRAQLYSNSGDETNKCNDRQVLTTSASVDNKMCEDMSMDVTDVMSEGELLVTSELNGNKTALADRLMDITKCVSRDNTMNNITVGNLLPNKTVLGEKSMNMTNCVSRENTINNLTTENMLPNKTVLGDISMDMTKCVSRENTINNLTTENMLPNKTVLGDISMDMTKCVSRENTVNNLTTENMLPNTTVLGDISMDMTKCVSRENTINNLTTGNMLPNKTVLGDISMDMTKCLSRENTINNLTTGNILPNKTVFGEQFMDMTNCTPRENTVDNLRMQNMVPNKTLGGNLSMDITNCLSKENVVNNTTILCDSSMNLSSCTSQEPAVNNVAMDKTLLNKRVLDELSLGSVTNVSHHNEKHCKVIENTNETVMNDVSMDLTTSTVPILDSMDMNITDAYKNSTSSNPLESLSRWTNERANLFPQTVTVPAKHNDVSVPCETNVVENNEIGSIDECLSGMLPNTKSCNNKRDVILPSCSEHDIKAMSPDIVKVGKRLSDGIPDVTPPHKKAKEQTEDIVYPNRTINMSASNFGEIHTKHSVELTHCDTLETESCANVQSSKKCDDNINQSKQDDHQASTGTHKPTVTAQNNSLENTAVNVNENTTLANSNTIQNSMAHSILSISTIQNSTLANNIIHNSTLATNHVKNNHGPIHNSTMALKSSHNSTQNDTRLGNCTSRNETHMSDSTGGSNSSGGSSVDESNLLTFNQTLNNTHALWKPFYEPNELVRGDSTVGEYFKLFQVTAPNLEPVNRRSSIQSCIAPTTSNDLHEKLMWQFMLKPQIEVYEWACKQITKKHNSLLVSCSELEKEVPNVVPDYENMNAETLNQLGVDLRSMCSRKAKIELREMKGAMVHQNITTCLQEDVVQLKSTLDELTTYNETLHRHHTQQTKVESMLEESLEVETTNCTDAEKLIEEMKNSIERLNLEKNEAIATQNDRKCKKLELKKRKELKEEEITALNKEISTLEDLTMESVNQEMTDKTRWYHWCHQSYNDKQFSFTFLDGSVLGHISLGDYIDDSTTHRKVTNVTFRSNCHRFAKPLVKLIAQMYIVRYENNTFAQQFTDTSKIQLLLCHLSTHVSELLWLYHTLYEAECSHDLYIDNYRLRFLFKSLSPLLRFHLTLTVDPESYPMQLIPWTMNKHFGPISEEFVKQILDGVKPGASYLPRMVAAIQHSITQLRP